MAPRTTLVWFFSFSSTSYIVPIVLYNTKKVNHANMLIESKNENNKKRMETKIMPYFCFWIKQSYMPNSMKKASSMSKDSNNLSKPHFGCYFHYILVNFKKPNYFLEHMDYLWLVKMLKKYCVWFGRYKNSQDG